LFVLKHLRHKYSHKILML